MILYRSSHVVISILITLLIIILGATPGCVSGSGASTPIIVHLSFSEPPILGKPVQLTATFSLSKNHESKIAKNVTAKFILSEGYELLEGNLEWNGDFVRGQSQTMVATIEATKTGNWIVAAEAGYSPGPDAFETGSKTLYTAIAENTAVVNDKPPSGGTFTPTPTSPPAHQTPETAPGALPTTTPALSILKRR
jgi:hypothetical protein